MNSRESLEALGKKLLQATPMAKKVAGAGHLDKLVASMYGCEEMTPMEAVTLVGAKFATEKQACIDQMKNLVIAMEGVDSDEIKVAEAFLSPEGVMPEAWNILRIEKAAHLLDLADLFDQAGDTSKAKACLDQHTKLASMGFDYFCAYGRRLAEEFENHAQKVALQGSEEEKTASSGIINSMREGLDDVIANPKVRDYGGALLKGAAGALGLGAVGAPIAAYTADRITDDVTQKLRDRALQTAAGTAGIVVGANQLNNILSNISKTASDKDTPIHAFSKVAFHIFLDNIIEDIKEKKPAEYSKVASLHAENKVAGAHAFYEFFKEETAMFDYA